MTSEVNGELVLKTMRYDFEKVAAVFLALELTQGREKVDQVLASIGSDHLRDCVSAPLNQLRDALCVSIDERFL